MRKYLLGLFAVVMAVSLSAFTSANSKSIGETNDLHWFEYSAANGGTVGNYLGEGDRSEFVEAPCNLLTGTDCRRGYPEAGLIDPSDPDQGPANKNSQADQIRKL